MNEDYNNINQNNDNDLMSNNTNNTDNNIFSDESAQVTSNVVTNNDTQDNSVDNTQINTQSINNDQVSSVFTSNEIPKSKGSNFKGIIIAIIIILLIIAITIGVLSVTGFFDNKKSNGDSGSNSGIIDNGSSNNKSNTIVDLSSEYKIPLEEIYFSVPNWHETELTGYTEKFTKYGDIEDGVKKGERYVTITGDGDIKANSSKEAFDKCSKLFISAVDYSSAKEFNIEKEENVKINGIDMYKFEGKLVHELGSNKNLFTIGYAFTINDIALQITGVVVDEEQPEELITEMKNIVNEMAKHVRTTE